MTLNNIRTTTLLICLTILLSPLAFAQGTQIGGDDFSNPTEYTLGGIRFEGAERYDQNVLSLLTGLQVGRKYLIPGKDISDAIDKLWEKKYFSDIQVFSERVDQGKIYLLFKVKDRPRVSKYKFTNVSKGHAKKISEMIDIDAGKVITETRLKNAELRIKEFYWDKGFYNVKVDIQQTMDTSRYNERILNFVVNTGPRVKIKYIDFQGNSYPQDKKIDRKLKDWRLRKVMKDTKQQGILRIMGRSKYQDDVYQKDKKALIEYMRSTGLRDANVVKDSVFAIDDKHLGIRMDIATQDLYYFGDITWVGNSKYRSSFLDTILGVKYGDIYDPMVLQERLFMSASGTDVSSLYMDNGHLFFNITPVEKSVTDNHINFEMRIVEGKIARNGKIIIRGNTKTNDRVILREIRTQPGDIFRRSDIIRTQRELAALGFFDPEQIQINPIPNPQDGTVDIEYVVVERSSDQVELSGGWGGAGFSTSSRGRLIGTLGLSFNNFSVRNMFRKGGWRPIPAGDGQTLNIRAQTNGKYFQAYNFSFTEPWLGGKRPHSLTFALFHSLSSNGIPRSETGATRLSRTGGIVGLGWRLKWPDDYFSAYTGISYEYYDVLNGASYFALDNGYSHNLSLELSLTRNSVSQPLYPRSGSQFKLSAKLTPPYSAWQNIDFTDVSDQVRYKFSEYFKIKAVGEWYLPITKDQKLVLLSRIGFGFLGYYNASRGISPFGRFYMGGASMIQGYLDGRELINLRGYPDQGISNPEGDPIIAKYTMELRYPISLNPNATVYALTFAEAGNTWENIKTFNPFEVKRSVGLGVRVFLPMFGMLGLDYGFGFDRLDPGKAGASETNSAINSKGYFGKLHFTIGMNLGEL